MKRRVIQIANSTHLISLPKTWTKKYGVQKGDEVEVAETGSNVTVSTDKAINDKKREIDISNLNGMTVKKLLYGLYATGYQEIRINFDKIESLDQVQTVLTDEMIGYEIIEQKDNYVIAKSIAGGFETEFDNMLRRALIMLKTMSSGIYDAIKKQDPKTLNTIRQLEVNNNKYIAFCCRILSSQGVAGNEKSLFIYGILLELEKAADQLKYLCLYLSENKSHIKDIDKNALNYFMEVIDYFDQAYDLFYKFSLESADEFYSKRKGLIEKGTSIMNQKSQPHSRLAFYSINFVQNISDMITRKMESEL